MTYDNIKSHKKPRFHTLSLEDIFSKNHREEAGGQIDPLPAVLGLNIKPLKENGLTFIFSKMNWLLLVYEQLA